MTVPKILELQSHHSSKAIFSALILSNSLDQKMTSNISPSPSPHRAVYGFAIYVFFVSLFIIYCLWVYLPQQFLEETLGLHYLPDKYFALAIPVIILSGTWIFAFLIYPSIGLAMTPKIDHISTIKDSKTIYRCVFVNSNGQVCENIIDEEEHSLWVKGHYCDIHSKNFVDDGGKVGEKIKCGHCPEWHGIGDDINGFPMPAARDMDLREICEEMFQ